MSPTRTPGAGFTGRLEVEGHELAPTDPHGQWVVVGGVQALSFGVDAAQLTAVVLQELLALAAVGVFLCLGLGEGGHVPITCLVCANLCKHQAAIRAGMRPG